MESLSTQAESYKQKTGSLLHTRRVVALLLLSLILVGGAFSFATPTAHAASVPAPHTVAHRAEHPLVAGCYLQIWYSNSVYCVSTPNYNGIAISLNNVYDIFLNTCTEAFWVHYYDSDGTAHTVYYQNLDTNGGIGVNWYFLTQVDVYGERCSV